MPYIEGEDRHQIYLLSNTLDDFVDEENPVLVIDAYVGVMSYLSNGMENKMGKSIGVTLVQASIFADKKSPAPLPKEEER
ncbi:hypothetical protein [Alkalihalobacillus deserti]|uniref:hypothetical protein n=1 Tax=Alkalihalobacillus deserti TaxID=2879466 RepID=UPI00223E6C76|nr:hypothetical protein [Alkalihalobacillus deserti]